MTGFVTMSISSVLAYLIFKQITSPMLQYAEMTVCIIFLYNCDFASLSQDGFHGLKRSLA